MLQKIYPRSKDKETVYLKSVITNPIQSGNVKQLN